MTEETFTDSRNSWFLGYFFSNLAGGIISPLIPLFVVLYLNLNVFYVGLTTSVVSLASIPALISWGNLSDSVKKRKPFIMIGFLGSFVALIPISLVANLTLFLFIQILFQILAMAAVPVSTMIIIENVEKSKWPIVMSKFNLIASLGTMIGLAVGSLLIFIYPGDTVILVRLYELASMIYLAAALTAYFVIPESTKKVSRISLRTIHSPRIMERIRFFPSTIIHFVGMTSGMGGKKLGKDLWIFLFCTFFLMTAFQMYFVPFPVFIIDSLKGNSSTVFLMFLINAMLGTIAYRYTGGIIKKFGVRNVLAGSLGTRAVLFSAMATVPFIIYTHLPFMTLAIAFYGVMGGLWGFIGISEVSYISGIAKARIKGKAIGYYNSFNGLGQIIGGIVSGAICELLGYGTDFIIATVMVVIGAVMIIKITRDEGYKLLFPRLKPSV